MDVKRSLVSIAFRIKCLLDKRRTRDSGARPPRECRKQIEFDFCKIHVGIVHKHETRIHPNGHCAHRHCTRRVRKGRSPQPRPHACEQFLRPERFGEVVVSAQFQCAHFVGGLAAGAQDKHRNLLALRADMFQDVKAVAAGQHQIEQDEVESLQWCILRLISPRHPRHGKPGRCECVLHLGAESGVVFDEQDVWCHRGTVVPRSYGILKRALQNPARWGPYGLGRRSVMRHHISFVTSAILLALACSTPTAPTAAAVDSTTLGTGGSSTAPTWYAKFGSAVTVSVEGTNVVLRSTGVPDHASPYWGTGHALYEAPHAGMQVNPNRIATQSLVLRVPMSPTRATASDTPMGPMGLAINGVALFNQYAAGRAPLTNEIVSFDRFNGHPQNTGQYHYHLEPLWLTSRDGMAALIGVLLDGFPVYGPREGDGSMPSGLDTCNGHTHATADVPSGTYHYHVTATVPYISGCFAGVVGTLG